MKANLSALLFLMFFSFPFIAEAQGGHSVYLDYSSKWTLKGGAYYYHPGCTQGSPFASDRSYIWYSINGDSIVSGVAYYKVDNVRIDSTFCSGELYRVDTSYSTEPWLIREDSTKKFLRYDTYDSSETVLINFDLQIGDTAAPWKCVIGQIDSVYLGSQWRKKYICSCDTDKYLLEGVGSTESFYEAPDCATPIHGGFYSACFKNNDFEYPFLSEECPLLSTSIIEQSGERRPLLYPNPTNGLVHLNVKAQKVEIFNQLGNLTKICSPDETQRVDLNGLAPGIYLVRVYTDKVFTQKLIVE